MSDREKKMKEASENITKEFFTKQFSPDEAEYVLFLVFLNVSISSGTPIQSIFNFMSLLTDWQQTLYKKALLGAIEEESFQNLLKNIDLSTVDLGEI